MTSPQPDQGTPFLVHARIVRGAVRSAALATAVTSTLTWAPTATAQPTEPTPPVSTAPTETPALDAGSIAITKTDSAGDPLAGASFLLLDPAGQEVGRGKTDARGKLTLRFPGGLDRCRPGSPCPASLIVFGGSPGEADVQLSCGLAHQLSGALPTHAIGRPSLLRPQCGSSIEVS